MLDRIYIEMCIGKTGGTMCCQPSHVTRLKKLGAYLSTWFITQFVASCLSLVDQWFNSQHVEPQFFLHSTVSRPVHYNVNAPVSVSIQQYRQHRLNGTHSLCPYDTLRYEVLSPKIINELPLPDIQHLLRSQQRSTTHT